MSRTNAMDRDAPFSAQPPGPAPYRRGMRSLWLLPAGLLVAAAVLSGCSSEPVGITSSSSLKPQGFTGSAENPSSSMAPDASDPTAPASTESPDAASGDTQVRPNAEGMAVETLADAVLDQVTMTSPDSFSDQLVTIAMSPLLREMAASADISAQLDSKGEKVLLVLSGDEVTCRVAVTDEPAARGVVCTG